VKNENLIVVMVLLIVNYRHHESPMQPAFALLQHGVTWAIPVDCWYTRKPRNRVYVCVEMDEIPTR